MINPTNPWKGMLESSQRRIDNKSNHNIFWITDLEGRYGFYLKSKLLFKNIKKTANLKGILVLKRNSANNGELFLILNDKEDWQIFYSLCEDLISVTHKYEKDDAMVSAVEVRLNRWQRLLKQDRNNEMSLEKQMGLFGELSCIIQILQPNIGVISAIISWVGADFDKQDFLLDEAIIEVKAYRTSKSPVVKISSLKQLFSEKEPIYLLTYGLSQSENGESIETLVSIINKLLEDKPNEIKEIFEDKLLEYGYIPELIRMQFYKFIIDKNRIFHVADNFPKITPLEVMEHIVSVKYSIDLIKCIEFEKDIKSIFPLGV